jgi:hypothetical protein
VLGVVISMIALATAPTDSNLVLLFSVLDPIEARVHGFASLDLGPLIANPSVAVELSVTMGVGLAWGLSSSSRILWMWTISWPL